MRSRQRGSREQQSPDTSPAAIALSPLAAAPAARAAFLVMPPLVAASHAQPIGIGPGGHVI